METRGDDLLAVFSVQVGLGEGGQGCAACGGDEQGFWPNRTDKFCATAFISHLCEQK